MCTVFKIARMEKWLFYVTITWGKDLHKRKWSTNQANIFAPLSRRGTVKTVPICKWFLRGTCKFGSRCWYRHPQQSQAPSSQDTKDYLKRLHERTDLELKRKLAQYAPYKSKYPFPSPQVVYSHYSPRSGRVLLEFTTQDGIIFLPDRDMDGYAESARDLTRYKRVWHWSYNFDFPDHVLGPIWRQLRQRDAIIDFIIQELFPEVLGKIVASYAVLEITPVYVTGDYSRGGNWVFFFS